MKKFKFKNGYLKTPVFFPDATRAVIRALDSKDIKETKTRGVLVNTYHLYTDLGEKALKKFRGIRQFMGFEGAVISDSGGFQVMSLCKTHNGKVTDEGVKFNLSKNKSMLLTPEKSIKYQMLLNPDMLVVLDDFTMPRANKRQARESVERTILWARRCKVEFEKICKKKKIAKKDRPYLLAVIQGGKYQDLRKECGLRLRKIGFDGYGYGGWPMNEDNKFDLISAKTIVKAVGNDKFLYGLGIGKPEDIVACVKLGFNIFDCVLPTRDARHGRLYVYKAESIDKIDVNKKNFYEYLSPKRGRYANDNSPISKACDCLLCRKYSRAYLYHLFKIKDLTAYRLATIHNLRFYSILMEKLQLQG
ncbi:MAG: tRNA guanosine(34) transglycosylase Tgt [Patescibacteria group bacterium]|nr:tRNA guanosine(34) transglycosylase Tgt [Patescibacteria group bacterium]